LFFYHKDRPISQDESCFNFGVPSVEIWIPREPTQYGRNEQIQVKLAIVLCDAVIPLHLVEVMGMEHNSLKLKLRDSNLREYLVELNLCDEGTKELIV